MCISCPEPKHIDPEVMDNNYTSNVTVESVALLKGYHLDMVGGPSTPPDPESDAGGSLSSWQGHPSW
jgi:hypothetical protein